MKRVHLAQAAAAALLLAVAACGQSATTTSTTEASTTQTSAPPAPPVLPPVTPADFVQKVAISDMFEIQASQLAVRRAQNASIRAFATQMVHDHTATTAQLRTIVHGHADLPLPTALDQAHTDMLTELRNANAAEFDQKYVDQQTHAHEDAEHLLSDYSHNGENDALKGFAAETEPKVQHHLDMVRALDHSGADEPAATHP